MEFTAIVRHVAQFFAGWLVSKGYVDGSMQDTVIGVLMGVSSLGWYWYSKKKA